MISVIRVFYKETPVMLKKEERYPKHVHYLDQVEGLPNTPILWGVPYIMQIPSMEEITRMMGNVTNAVCGRVQSSAIEEGKQTKTPEPAGKKSGSMQTDKVRNNVQLRNKTDKKKSSGKHIL